MKKLVGAICVYNDAEYLDYTIRSVKDQVDELLIVEGAFQCTMTTNGVTNGRTPRSNDGTLNIIDKYVDNQRVFSVAANEKEHKYQYQVGLDWAKSRGADWHWLIDSDEVYKKSTWSLIRQKIEQSDKTGAYEFRVNAYCFVNDFRHYYNGQYPRLFKVTPEARFIFDNEIVWPDHGKQQDMGRVEGHIHLLSQQPSFWHYSYVRQKQRWKLKQESVYEKDFNPINLQYGLENDKYILPNDIKIYEYTGMHPEIMLDHPYYTKTASEIIYG